MLNSRSVDTFSSKTEHNLMAGCCSLSTCETELLLSVVAGCECLLHDLRDGDIIIHMFFAMLTCSQLFAHHATTISTSECKTATASAFISS